MTSPLDAFDFDDGLPHVIDDEEEAEAERHLLSPCGSNDTNDDGVLLYFLTDSLGRPPHSAVFGGPAAAVVTPKDPALDVADLFNEDIGEWPVDDAAPIISTPKVPELAYNDVDIAPQSPKSRAKSKDKGRPRIKLSLKKTNRATSATNAKIHRKIPSLKDDSKRGKKKPSTSKYTGVSRVSGKKQTSVPKYDSKFSSVRMGTYLLETDAALAYDGAVRASGRKDQRGKINFEDEEEYRKAREGEVADRGLHEGMVPLEEALAQISAKVDAAVEKMRLKKEGVVATEN